MWYLVEDSPDPDNTPPPKYWLGGTHSGGRVIGRKNSHILIKFPSVSRTHATIRVVPTSPYHYSEDSMRRRKTSVVVEDDSAYGTYVKYPPGHAANRAGEVEGHHRRLDKNIATEVQEGALLAFGAPSAWWRLGWCAIVCFPSGLWARHQERLQEVTKSAGLEVVEEYSQHVTHFITGECKTSSMKFLSALVHGKHIVTPAWANSIQQTVKEACKEVADAQHNLAALAACKLAPEALYAPPFHASDKATYSADVLDSVFSEGAKQHRKSLFESDVFSFCGEDRRSKWAPVLEYLGASTILLKATKGHPREKSVVFVAPDPSKRKRSTGDSTPHPAEGGLAISETMLVKAILAGNKSDITRSKLLQDDAPVAGSPVDAADEYEGTVDGGDGRESVSEIEVPEIEEPRSTMRKRSTSVQKSVAREDNSTSVMEGRRLSDKDRNPSIRDLADDATKTFPEKERDDQNEREYFKVAPVITPEIPARTEVSGQDVRRFRRKYLPRASKVSLKRARYMEDENAIPSRKSSR